MKNSLFNAALAAALESNAPEDAHPAEGEAGPETTITDGPKGTDPAKADTSGTDASETGAGKDPIEEAHDYEPSDDDQGDLVDGLKQAEFETAAINTQAGELADACTGLESIMHAIESAHGGLTPREAQFAAIAVEAHVGKWDLGVSLVPSMESFGGTQSRTQATSLALENLQDTVKQAIQYVVELFQKAVTAIAGFLDRIFHTFGQLGNRARALKAASSNLKGTAAAELIDVATLAPRYAIGVHAPTHVRDVFAKLDTLFGMCLEADKVVTEMETAAASAFADVLTLTDETFAARYAELDKSFENVAKVPSFFKEDGEGKWSTDVFPGNVKYVAVKSSPTALPSYHKVAEKVEFSGTKIKPLDVAEISQIADLAIKFSVRAATAQNALGINKDATVKPLLASLKSNTALTGANARTAATFIRLKAQRIQAARTCAAQMLGDALGAAVAALKVAELSAKQYEGGPGFRAPGTDKDLAKAAYEKDHPAAA